MISVLVPVFNREAGPLIAELSRQLNESSDGGEIVVFDDGSSAEYRKRNEAIGSLPGVRYRELDKNYGRMRIRQMLAAEAGFDWLLFLDGDSRILQPGFLRRYLSALSSGHDVYSGGRVYGKRPDDCSRRLHWKYGIDRESAKGRKTAFHSNNFCIRKDLFLSLPFPGWLTGYGHEDTWMGIELERRGKKIDFIDNPVEHTDIENTAGFLAKTEQALQNLWLLRTAAPDRLIAKHVSLFRAYQLVRQLHLSAFIQLIYASMAGKIRKNLNSCHPSLAAFDLFRLHYFLRIAKDKEDRADGHEF